MVMLGQADSVEHRIDLKVRPRQNMCGISSAGRHRSKHGEPDSGKQTGMVIGCLHSFTEAPSCCTPRSLTSPLFDLPLSRFDRACVVLLWNLSIQKFFVTSKICQS